MQGQANGELTGTTYFGSSLSRKDSHDLGLRPIESSGRNVRVPLDENGQEIRPLVLVVEWHEVTDRFGHLGTVPVARATLVEVRATSDRRRPSRLGGS